MTEERELLRDLRRKCFQGDLTTKEWDTVDAFLSRPAREPGAWRNAMKNLVFAARITGGVAGPDENLKAACAECENILLATSATTQEPCASVLETAIECMDKIRTGRAEDIDAEDIETMCKHIYCEECAASCRYRTPHRPGRRAGDA